MRCISFFLDKKNNETLIAELIKMPVFYLNSSLDKILIFLLLLLQFFQPI